MFPSFPRVLKSARPQCDWVRGDVTERIALLVESKSAFITSVLGVMRYRDAARGTRFQGFFGFLEGLLARFTHNLNCCGEWLGMDSACFQDDVRCVGSLSHKSSIVPETRGIGDVYNPPEGQMITSALTCRRSPPPMLLLCTVGCARPVRLWRTKLKTV